MSKKGKLVFNIVAAACVVSCVVLLYFGFVFFSERTLVFVLYNGYIILLTILIIYMAHRYIKTYIA
ncbi:MAG: hypothetical protein ACE5F7_00720 [Nitrospiria bacterium]